jgi:hypothetical protein
LNVDVGNAAARTGVSGFASGRHGRHPEKGSMNYQELVQKTSERCGIEFPIVDEIIGTLLTLATEQFTSFKICDDQSPEWLARARV